MKFKRRETEVFSLSFLDCICCGFGAILLLFVLTAGKKADTIVSLEARIEQVRGLIEDIVKDNDKELQDLNRSLSIQRKRTQEVDVIVKKKKKAFTELEDKLRMLLEQLMTNEESKDKLLLDKDNMPTQEDEPPIPLPNVVRRQYLTGFDMLGDNVLFLVEASGGMVADNIEKAIERMDDSDDEKQNAPKWIRVKKGIKWMIGNLKQEANYKIVFFNKEIIPIELGYGADWFAASDKNMTLKVLKEIDKIVPEGGANLERAFDLVDELEIDADRIILIADGLPTQADSYQMPSAPDDHDRMNAFRAAKKALNTTAPVSVLLYPMMNDPGAAVYYWRLTDEYGGAMVCPSNSWPNI